MIFYLGKQALAVLAGLFLATQSIAYETRETTCGLPECHVKYRCRHEAYIGCEAIKRALKFFEENGYKVETAISIDFVKNKKKDETEDHSCESTIHDFPSFYNSRTKRIKIISRIGDYCWNRMFLGVFRLDMEFFISIVTHEVAHCLFDSIFCSRNEKSDHSFSEFVAYITQIETMQEPNKSLVLSLWPKETLPSISSINPFVWMAAPNKFCVMSYRYFKSHPEIIKCILEGTIKPMEMLFIWDY